MNLAKSTRNPNRRRVVAWSAAGCLLVLVSTKIGFDWYREQMDEQLELPSANLEKLFAMASQAESRRGPLRDYPWPDDLRAALKSPGDFHLSRRVAGIPNSVRAAFVQTTQDDAFRMAEPRGRWEATDLIRDPNLPRRRLIAVAISRTFCLLFYEQGGRGKSDHVAAFRLLGDRAETAWDGSIAPQIW